MTPFFQRIRSQRWLLASVMAGAALLIYFRPSAQNPDQFMTLSAPERTRVNSVSFSPDGKSLALSVQSFPARNGIASLGAQVQIHDAHTGSLQRTLNVTPNPNAKFPSGYIQSATFGGSGTEIACETFPLMVRDAQSGKTNHIWKQASVGRSGLVASPDGRFWASTSENSVQLWKVSDGRAAQKLNAPAYESKRKYLQSVSSTAFSPDGQTLVSGHNDGAVYLWDIATAKVKFTLSMPVALGGRGASVLRMAFAPKGSLIAAADARAIWLWDARSGRLLRTWNAPDKVSIFGLSFSPDGKVLAGGGPNFTWRRERGRSDGPRSEPREPDTVGEINFWDTSNGDWLSRQRGGHWIIHLAFSPDGKTLASSGDDNTALLWKAPQQSN